MPSGCLSWAHVALLGSPAPQDRLLRVCAVSMAGRYGHITSGYQKWPHDSLLWDSAPTPSTALLSMAEHILSRDCSAFSRSPSLCIHSPPATVSILKTYCCSVVPCLCPCCATLPAGVLFPLSVP